MGDCIQLHVAGYFAFCTPNKIRKLSIKPETVFPQDPPPPHPKSDLDLAPSPYPSASYWLKRTVIKQTRELGLELSAQTYFGVTVNLSYPCLSFFSFFFPHV